MTALRPGLVSVTFRKLSVEQVVSATVDAGLECIEWGGDIHVPHGDLATAGRVAALTRDQGLSISSYGSYLRLGVEGGPEPRSVVDTASALGAPLIRVWAGSAGSADAGQEDRHRVQDSALHLAQMAAESGMRIAYEFHSGTLTDTPDSARNLLASTNHPAITTLWQPPNGMEPGAALDSLQAVLPRLSNIHAFHWWPTPRERLSLSDGRTRWMDYLRLAGTRGGPRDVLLEFLPNDDPALLKSEAATLRQIIAATAENFIVSHPSRSR